MKISTRHYLPLRNIDSQKKSLLRTGIKTDNVYFSSNLRFQSKSSSAAEEFGIKLFELYNKNELTPQKIEEIGSQSIPILKVDNMKNLSKIMGADTSNYKAYTLPKYSQTCQLESITLYAPDKTMSAETIGSLVHEYCHCLQRYSDNAYMGLANVTNKNLLQARILNNLSAIIFGELEKRKFLECAHKFSLFRTAGMDENTALCSAYGCKNEKEFQKQIRKLFNSCYDSIITQFSNHPQIAEHMPLKNEPLKLKKVIKNQCSVRGNMEAEAYNVQRNVLNRILKNNIPSEIEMAPSFYKMIADALM